jgi:DNA (cytosine-5)-methyltransferase 1
VKPRLLDLFCCEGGAAAGYVEAGFEVHGVDLVHIDPTERKKQTRAMRARYLAAGGTSFTVADATTFPLDGFDVVHASPPCKDHTELASLSGGDGTGWMLPHTIGRIRESGLPYVIENVVSASTKRHMDGAIMLCGSMFGLGAPGTGFRRNGVTTHIPPWRTLQRHRLFLTSFPVLVPPDQCSGKPVGGVYGTGGGGQMTRGYKFNSAESRLAMQMPWASRNGCSQAIPPAYTQFLGDLMMAALSSVGAR